LSLKIFIERAVSRDTEFEEIMVDELTLRYQKRLKLPAGDVVLSAKEELEVYLGPDRAEQDVALGLSKLFPYTGTEISAGYEVAPRFSSPESLATLSFTLAQPIAENAFGRSTRLLERIVGLEIDIARHQIIEAYEDYLAFLVTAYLEWYEAYENLQIGTSSYKENLKLLDNIKDRQKNNIALPIDVNKITLQVNSKREKLVDLEELYKRKYAVIERSMRKERGEDWTPEAPEVPGMESADFAGAFETFRTDSRTYKVLDLLEKKSTLKVDRDADDLLPSIDLVVGYEREGRDFKLDKKGDLFFTGLRMEWPLPDQVQKAEWEISRVNREKTGLLVLNTHHRLYEQLKVLHQKIRREEQLTSIALEQIKLAQAVLKDESENYTFGRVSLNFYIDAVNELDRQRFSYILHSVFLQKLFVEWRRLTDRLVAKRDVEKTHPRFYAKD
jgi:outer membrane protein TolC